MMVMNNKHSSRQLARQIGLFLGVTLLTGVVVFAAVYWLLKPHKPEDWRLLLPIIISVWGAASVIAGHCISLYNTQRSLDAERLKEQKHACDLILEASTHYWSTLQRLVFNEYDEAAVTSAEKEMESADAQSKYLPEELQRHFTQVYQAGLIIADRAKMANQEAKPSTAYKAIWDSGADKLNQRLNALRDAVRDQSPFVAHTSRKPASKPPKPTLKPPLLTNSQPKEPPLLQ